MKSIGFIFILLSLLNLVLGGADFYKILGVPRNADEKQIKNAYRQMSKKYHPDKNAGDDSAQHKFMEIGNAYEVLMDKEKRSIYDRYGEEGLQNGGPKGGGDPAGDMFANFFGQQFQRGPPKGQDVSTQMEFTLSDFYNGINQDFSAELQDICDKCQGSGSADGIKHTCDTCKGRGRILQRRQLGQGMIQQFESACNKCGGTGKQIKTKCKKCSGNGVFRNKKDFNIHVQPGTPRNHVEIFPGEADKTPDVTPGDLRITIQEKTDGNMGYRRIGNNLYRTEVITLRESLIGGWERKIPFLDIYDSALKISRGDSVVTLDGEIEVMKNKGMPMYNSIDEFGDLFIEYKIIYPGGNKNKLKQIHDEL